jgi:flagellar biosynthesis protein FlhF
MTSPQTFRGSTLGDAKAAACAELGAEAVIITTRKIQRRGVRGLFGGYEVEVAATPPEPPLPEPPAPPPPPKVPVARTIFSSGVFEAEQPKPRAPEPPLPRAPISEPRPEVRALQTLVAKASGQPTIETEIAALRDAVDRLAEPPPARSGALAKILRDTGIEGKAAGELARLLKAAGPAPSPEMARDALGELVRVGPWPLADQGPALIALVGPSGVGKTTTAAKLAAIAMFDMNRTVTFVTCDGVRVGAYEQIERFADLLGAAIVAVRTPAEMQRAVDAATTDIVIIDTAGRSPNREGSAERALKALPGMGGKARSRHVLLCLPAAVRADDAARFVRDFAPTRPTALCITKLDETMTPAGLVHGAVAAKLPASVLCFGQRVPEDIAPATTGAVLDYLLPKGSARRRMS